MHTNWWLLAAAALAAAAPVRAASSADLPSLQVGFVVGRPGHSVDVPVYLFPESTTVASTTHDLSVAAPLRIQANADGTPDCADPTQTYRGTFSFLPPGCAGDACIAVHAQIGIAVALPFQATLYGCAVDIPADTISQTYPVKLNHAEVTDQFGTVLPVPSLDGSVAVQFVPQTPTLTVQEEDEGMPGASVGVEVYLHLPDGMAVATVQNDLSVAPPLAIQARADGTPECTGTYPGSFTFVPPGCAGNACSGVHAAVDIGVPTNEGMGIYECDVTIAPDAAPGYYPVTIGNVAATDSAGDVLAGDGINDVITVPELPKHATIVVGSAEGMPGQTVTFEVSVDTSIAAQVTEIEDDITFDLLTPILADPDGKPLCTAPGIVNREAIYSFDCIGTSPCNGVFADVGNVGDLPPYSSGQPVYSCTVAISPSASPGSYPLICAPDVHASDYYTGSVGARCSNGEIRVLAPPTPTRSPTASEPPTATVSRTPIGTLAVNATATPPATGAPTLVPTSTSKISPTRTPQPADSDSCTIAAPAASRPPWPLLLPIAALWFIRERSRGSRRAKSEPLASPSHRSAGSSR